MYELVDLVPHMKNKLHRSDVGSIELHLFRLLQEGFTIEQIAERGNVLAIELVNVRFRHMLHHPVKNRGTSTVAWS